MKFIFSPRKFFIDMYKKRLIQGKFPMKLHAFKKVIGNNKYSVVTAVYGVDKYLDKYFVSIENQSLNFSDHIELIMVDDGSLDGSAEIIKKWVKKYPNNIKYVKKENGGQASARNLGMESVSNDWVTFIDPDDFVDTNYFLEVDKVISKNGNIGMVSCNFIFYMEKGNRFSDTHPLRCRFDNHVSIHKVDNLEGMIQLSANSVFFLTDVISKNQLEMSPKIKPSFEDAHFVGKYLLKLINQEVGFVKAAKYYYRKRADNTSAIDNSWSTSLQYTDKLTLGYFDLLAWSQKEKGFIPTFIQRTVLYDLIWYFKKIVNNKEMLSFLSEKELMVFKENLQFIFNLIDEKVILDFELAAFNTYFKMGFLNLFKENYTQIYDVNIEAYDFSKREIRLRYYFVGDSLKEHISCQGQAVLPVHEKIIEHYFLDDIFVFEKNMWISIPEEQGNLEITLNDQKASIKVGSLIKKEDVSFAEINSHFETPKINENLFPYHVRILRKLARISAYLPGYQDAWVFIDRDIQADDNAEHLYCYVKKHNPKLNLRFLIRKSSQDWARLEKEGFNLIPFGSIRHMIILFNAKNLVSSHADNYVLNYPPHSWFKGILRYRYTFLQHGVIKDDLSGWLNKKPIDVFVTASEAEYLSIAGKKNTYKFSSKEVLLSGLARHDKLLKMKAQMIDKITTKTILIMPTWRQSLAGQPKWMSNDRGLNNKFQSSLFASSWKSFLNSKELNRLSKLYDLDIIFFPHANISPYLDWFDVPGYISTMKHNGENSIQDLFAKASLMITDYSSVAFEMAYLEKPIIYYQFDRDKVFGGEHLTKKGYFDYHKDGFGPVCDSEQELLESLNDQLEKNLIPEEKYMLRMNNTFKYKDGKNCQRIYEAILDLEKS